MQKGEHEKQNGKEELEFAEEDEGKKKREKEIGWGRSCTERRNRGMSEKGDGS